MANQRELPNHPVQHIDGQGGGPTSLQHIHLVDAARGLMRLGTVAVAATAISTVGSPDANAAGLARLRHLLAARRVPPFVRTSGRSVPES